MTGNEICKKTRTFQLKFRTFVKTKECVALSFYFKSLNFFNRYYTNHDFERKKKT
jgi:hypothetical protein